MMVHLLPALVIVGLVLAIRKVLTANRERTQNTESYPVFVEREAGAASAEIPESKENDREVGIRSRPFTSRLNPEERAEWGEQRGPRSDVKFTPSAKKAKASPFNSLTKQQLREGIILAEVLSEKPRAKNPHPAVLRYRRMKS